MFLCYFCESPVSVVGYLGQRDGGDLSRFLGTKDKTHNYFFEFKVYQQLKRIFTCIMGKEVKNKPLKPDLNGR